MCLAIPMKIVEVNGQTALVDMHGVTREVRIDFVEGAQAGDYLLVHAGMAIERVDPAEAEETLRLIREIIEHEIH